MASVDRKQVQASKKKKDQKKSFKSAFVLDRKNPNFIHYFNEISSERINKQRLREFLTKRYKESLAQRIANALGPYFGNYVQTITFQIYCDGLEMLFQLDEKGLKEFAYKVMDMNNDKKLSENDMFDLMKQTSAVKGGYYQNPDLHKNAEILPLNQKKFDLFLDVFSSDYIKITKAIERKKDAKGMNVDDLGASKKFEQFGIHTFSPKNMNKIKTDKNPTGDDSAGGNLTVKKEPQVASKSDPSMFLTKEEFCNIQFDREWPLIVKDLAHYLTNMDLLKGTRISEQDEYTSLITQQEFFKDIDI